MDKPLQRDIDGCVVRIDPEQCIASGNCTKVAPDVFEIDAEGTVAFVAGERSSNRETVVEACRVCPVDALTVTSEDGEQLVP